jgi:hypothetical protein
MRGSSRKPVARQEVLLGEAPVRLDHPDLVAGRYLERRAVVRELQATDLCEGLRVAVTSSLSRHAGEELDRDRLAFSISQLEADSRRRDPEDRNLEIRERGRRVSSASLSARSGHDRCGPRSAAPEQRQP